MLEDYQGTITWLLQSDPSIRFQTKRDLLNKPESDWKVDQESIQTLGWGARLLRYQQDDGRWDNGLYGPKFTSTHYTLLTLSKLEMLPNPQSKKGCDQLVKIKAIGEIDSDNTKLDMCITGMGLGILSHFKSHETLYSEILEFMDERKMPDGGWNCRHPRIKSTHSSFNTTLLVLEGLDYLWKNFPSYRTEVENLRESAHECLLLHELYKSHTTKELIHPQFIEMSFPPRWKYNILSALNYFQSINHKYDNRMRDALEMIKSKEKNGYWSKGKQMTGKKFFTLEITKGRSEFNTLRALRVLKRYNQ